jgi:dTDP-4-dehydrorhamnose reductase
MAASDKPVIIITGGAGLLGLNWGYHIRDRYAPVLGLHAREIQPAGLATRHLPLESKAVLLPVLEALAPRAIIHTAGLTSIEGCEADPALARQVNVEVSRYVSEACKEMAIPMIHISTDNLFDGNSAMVTEDAPVNPVNVYGQTKAEAELVIQECHDDVIIVRTNFYGWGPVYKPSFSDTIIRSLRNGGDLSLFEDVYYTPILISDLVNAAHDLLEKGRRGVFHVVGDERLSKYDFGHRVADAFDLDASGIRAGRLKDMANLAKRPFDMSMSNEKTRVALGRSLGTLAEQLVRLREQENSNLTRSIHEVDSIR